MVQTGERETDDTVSSPACPCTRPATTPRSGRGRRRAGDSRLGTDTHRYRAAGERGSQPDHRRPHDTGMHYRAGSVTKTFVATITLQLVGEGRLRLEDRVARWLPRLLPHAETITLRQLLNHTSGIFDYLEDPTFSLAASTGKVFRPEELVLIAALHPNAGLAVRCVVQGEHWDLRRGRPCIPEVDHPEIRADRPQRCCSRRKSDGEDCGSWAMRGQRVCRMHGGASPQARQAAARRVAAAKQRRAVGYSLHKLC
jgi:hypothetical protein